MAQKVPVASRHGFCTSLGPSFVPPHPVSWHLARNPLTPSSLREPESTSQIPEGTAGTGPQPQVCGLSKTGITAYTVHSTPQLVCYPAQEGLGGHEHNFSLVSSRFLPRSWTLLYQNVCIFLSLRCLRAEEDSPLCGLTPSPGAW